MEFRNYLKSLNLQQFSDVKTHLEEIGLQIKDNDQLYLVTYDRNDEEGFRNKIAEYPFMKECRGLIVEKDTNNIICYPFNVSPEYNYFLVSSEDDPSYQEMTNIWNDKVAVYESSCGTQMRLFYYSGEWHVATQRCMDARRSFWDNNKSFYDLFVETMKDKWSFEDLNQEYCYVMVLKHPLNRIIVPCHEAEIHHVLTRDMSTEGFPEVDCRVEGTTFSDDVSDRFSSFNDLLEEINTPSRLDKEGYIIKYPDSSYTVGKQFFRMKLLTWDYRRAKELRGNYTTLNSMYHYLTIRKSEQVDEYLLYFPEEKNTFVLMESEFNKLRNRIQSEYYKRHVIKSITNDQITFPFSPVLYKLHGLHLQNREVKISREVVGEELLKMDVPYVCFLINKSIK